MEISRSSTATTQNFCDPTLAIQQELFISRHLFPWIKLHRIGKSGSTDPLTECRISTSRQGLVDKTAPTIRMINGFLFRRNGIFRLQVPSIVRDSLLAQLSFFNIIFLSTTSSGIFGCCIPCKESFRQGRAAGEILPSSKRIIMGSVGPHDRGACFRPWLYNFHTIVEYKPDVLYPYENRKPSCFVKFSLTF